MRRRDRNRQRAYAIKREARKLDMNTRPIKALFMSKDRTQGFTRAGQGIDVTISRSMRNDGVIVETHRLSIMTTLNSRHSTVNPVQCKSWQGSEVVRANDLIKK